MALQQTQSFIVEVDYLQGELLADLRGECIDGEVYAMAGASRNQQRLIGNLQTTLNGDLFISPCETFASKLKVKAVDLRIDVAELYHRVYPEDIRVYLQQLQQQAG